MKTRRSLARSLRVSLLALLSAGPAFAGASLPPAAAPTPAPRLLQSGVIPAEHLRSAAARVESGGTVTVCFIGDSTTVGTPNGVHSRDGLVYQIERQFWKQNPGVTFSFQNFAIPGSTMAAYLNSSEYTAAQSYGLTWYSSAANWYQFVQNANCHVVVMNWGVNDSYNFIPATWSAVMDRLQGQGASSPQHPDVLAVTNAIYNPNAGGVGAQSTYRAGYYANSSLQRNMAAVGEGGFTNSPVTIWPPVGIIDVGRFFQQAVSGVDYEDQTSTDVTASLSSLTPTISVGAYYTLPRTDGDFELVGSFVGALSSMSSKTSVKVSISSMDGTGTSALGGLLTLLPNTGGTNVAATYGNSSGVTLTKNMAMSGADMAFDIAVKGDEMSVTLGNSASTWDIPLIKSRAPFTPTVTLSGGTGPQSLPLTISKYDIGTARKYNTILSASQAYGPTVVTAATTGATVSGGTVLQFASVASNIAVGMPLTDVPVPNAIPAGATVAAIDRTANTVTIDAGHPVASIGVASGDNISFGSSSWPTGGNGINHDASDALNYVYGSAVQAANLCIICATENGSALASRATQVPTSGSTITAAQGLRHLMLNPAAGLAALTVTLPPNARDGDVFDVATTQAITALTVAAPTSPTGVAVQAPTNPMASNPGAMRMWKYNASLNTWVEWS